jgi:arylsulfatase A-like enzyme
MVSDHGEEFYEHELFGHGFSLYNEVLSVPLAVWGQGVPGGELTAPLEGRDVFDLVLALADVSSLPVDRWAEGHARSQRYASIYYSSEGRLALRPYIAQVAMRALQEGSEKLVWSAYGDTLELYDLTQDPGERVNLVSRRAERSRELAGLLEATVDRWSERTPLEASDEALEQMRALGYVDD